jgi:hypothetical protein
MLKTGIGLSITDFNAIKKYNTSGPVVYRFISHRIVPPKGNNPVREAFNPLRFSEGKK